ncbi:MAG: hypothetical protein E6P95_04165 [Candidatus Moraniibacteriota bacterium]|jgi:hypothetical protein|nr:MAG: hypothetical protein E6P95_04165 [Candidatus Moranbacteria bacterium]
MVNIPRRHPDDDPWILVFLASFALLIISIVVASWWGVYRIARALGIAKSLVLLSAVIGGVSVALNKVPEIEFYPGIQDLQSASPEHVEADWKVL